MIRLWTPAACRNARSLMLEGIEGRLLVPDRLDVEAHVGRCGVCAEELADLAAAHHSVRRAFEPYRSVHARVAPARARMRARERPQERGAFARLVLAARPAEQALAFAVLSLVFVGTLPAGVDQHASPRGPAAATYVRVADDPGGLLRLRALQSDRIPIGDGLVIEVRAPSPDRVPGERSRQGLRPSSAN